MIRTQIYLTVQEKEEITKIASTSGKKQSEIIREAVDSFLEKFHSENGQKVCENLSGIWADRPESFSADSLRGDWDREF